MAADMMDIDIDMGDLVDMKVDDVGNEVRVESVVSLQPELPQSNPTIPTSLEDPESRIQVSNKVHLRGLDNFKPEDLEALALKYYSAEMYERIEWIDDSSANLVYSSEKVAAEALRAYAKTDVGNLPLASILQMIPAKDFPGHPDTELFVRLAVLGDKKQPGAHERSKFYLLNPEYDTATTRRNRDYRQRNPMRRRYLDDPKYGSGRRNKRYDRRYRDEEEAEFNESYYDDDETSISSRRNISSRRKTSDGRGSSQNSFSGGDASAVRTRSTVKELFPGRTERGGSDGRLRNRSASPVREREVSKSDGIFGFQKDNRRKAQVLKASLQHSLQSQRPPVIKELFPERSKHRRPGAFDAAAKETADLFSRMSVPFNDGSNDDRLVRLGKDGISIKGSAARQQISLSGAIGFKGAAKANAAKELFPTRNSGKELLSEKIYGRGSQRRRAEEVYF